MPQQRHRAFVIELIRAIVSWKTVTAALWSIRRAAKVVKEATGILKAADKIQELLPL
jgi:hypothetical protein